MKHYEKPISVSELAEKTEINTKNIGKYLKILEDNKVIIRRPSEKDKRVNIIELIPRKMLYFFKFGNKFLLHTRTRLEKQDFKAFHGKKFSIIDIVRCLINIKIVHNTIKLWELRPKSNNDDDDEHDVKYYTPEPEMKYIYEYFYIFDKLCLELLEEYFGYTVHVYSKKEVRELRKKKVRTSVYSSIDFNENDNIVNLILEKKNGEKTIKTPFIYLDYFVLRLNDILTVKNTEKSIYKNKVNGECVETNNLYDFHNNQKTELVKREFNLTAKAFEYYRYIYNFGQFKTIYVEHRLKTKKEIKDDGIFEREREIIRNEYLEEVLESFNQQHQQNKLRDEKKSKEFWENNNKEFKEPIDKMKNYLCCINDLKKGLDKYDYRIAYEYLKINILSNVPYNAKYEKKDLDKIVMLIVKEAKKSDYIMEKVKQQERLRIPSLEKEVLCS